MNNNKPAEAEIIAFPPSKIVRMVPDESTQHIRSKNRKQNADEMVNMICTDLLYGFADITDIDTNTDDFKRDFSYTMEVLRATVYRAVGVEHPLHAHIDDMVKVAHNMDELNEILEDLTKDDSEEL